jgi:hypothetical protein
MFPNNAVHFIPKGVALVLLAVLLSTALLTGSAAGEPTPSLDTTEVGHGSAADFPVDTLSVEPAQTWVGCTPDSVASYNTRIHVRCTASVGGISYWAVSTENPAHAARMLSVLSTAKVGGRTLSLLYDPADTSNLPPGCLVSDCRLLLAAAIQ